MFCVCSGVCCPALPRYPLSPAPELELPSRPQGVLLGVGALSLPPTSPVVLGGEAGLVLCPLGQVASSMHITLWTRAASVPPKLVLQTPPHPKLV